MDAIIRQTVREEKKNRREGESACTSSEAAPREPNQRTVSRLSGLLDRIRGQSREKKRKTDKEHQIQVHWIHHDKKSEVFLPVRQRNGGSLSNLITAPDWIDKEKLLLPVAWLCPSSFWWNLIKSVFVLCSLPLKCCFHKRSNLTKVAIKKVKRMAQKAQSSVVILHSSVVIFHNSVVIIHCSVVINETVQLCFFTLQLWFLKQFSCYFWHFGCDFSQFETVQL